MWEVVRCFDYAKYLHTSHSLIAGPIFTTLGGCWPQMICAPRCLRTPHSTATPYVISSQLISRRWDKATQICRYSAQRKKFDLYEAMKFVFSFARTLLKLHLFYFVILTPRRNGYRSPWFYITSRHSNLFSRVFLAFWLFFFIFKVIVFSFGTCLIPIEKRQMEVITNNFYINHLTHWTGKRSGGCGFSDRGEPKVPQISSAQSVHEKGTKIELAALQSLVYIYISLRGQKVFLFFFFHLVSLVPVGGCLISHVHRRCFNWISVLGINEKNHFKLGGDKRAERRTNNKNSIAKNGRLSSVCQPNFEMSKADIPRREKM